MKKFLLLLWIFLVPVFCMTSHVYAEILPESELLPESEDSWEEDSWEEDSWEENSWEENGIIIEMPPLEDNTSSSNTAESEPSTSEDTQTEPPPTTSESDLDSSNTTGNNNTSSENTEAEPLPTTSESDLDSSDSVGNDNTSSENTEAEPPPTTSESDLGSSDTTGNNNTSSENTEAEPFPATSIDLDSSDPTSNNNTSPENTEAESFPTNSDSNLTPSNTAGSDNTLAENTGTEPEPSPTNSDSNSNSSANNNTSSESTKSKPPQENGLEPQPTNPNQPSTNVDHTKSETNLEDSVSSTTLNSNNESNSTPNNDDSSNVAIPSTDKDETPVTPEQLPIPTSDNPVAPSTVQEEKAKEEEEAKEETIVTTREDNSEPEVQPVEEIQSVEPVQDTQNTAEETVEEPNISQILANNVVVVADNLTNSFSVDAQIGPQQIFLIDIGEGYSKPKIVEHLNNSQIFIKDNLLTYIPNLGFIGIDTFSYTVTDSEGNAVDKQIRVKVTGKDEIIPVENCQLYFVHDGESSDSQFITVDPTANTVIKLGPQYDTFDVEGMAINPVNGLLYAISGKGKRNQFDGYLYRVNPTTGGLTVIGDTGFSEPSSLAFRPDGTLWSWSKKGRKDRPKKDRLKSAGIIQIDPNTAKSQLRFPSEVQVEGIAWDESGQVLYATEETSLWAFDSNQFRKRCSNLSAEVEALETLANGMLLLGFNEYDGNSVYLYDPESCEEIIGRSFPVPSIKGDFDVESIAWALDCQPTVAEETCLDEEGNPIADNTECPLEEVAKSTDCVDEEGKPITDNTECPLEEAVESTDCIDEEGNPVQNENCPAEPMNSVENPEETKAAESESCVDKEGNPIKDKECPMSETTQETNCEEGQSDCINQESEPVNQTQGTRQAQKEEANQQATHCPLDEMVPCPALDKEEVERFFANNPVAELVQLETDGLLFVLLDGQLHYGFFSYSLPPKRVKKLAANPILEVTCEQNDKTATQLKLAATEDIDGNGHDDFIMTYCDGQTQVLFYLGRADQAQEENMGEIQEQQTDSETTTEEGIGEKQEQQTDSETTTHVPEIADSEPKEEATSQPELTSFTDSKLNNAEDRASALELEPSNSDENQQELANNPEQEGNTSPTTETKADGSEEEITSIGPDKQEEPTSFQTNQSDSESNESNRAHEQEQEASKSKEESNKSLEKTELNLAEPAQLSSSPPEQDNSTDAVEQKQTSSKESSDKEKSAKQPKSSSQSGNEESTKQKESNGTATPPNESQPKESDEKQSGSSDGKAASSSSEQKKTTGSDQNPQDNSNDQDQLEVNNQENHTENPSN